MPGLFSWPWQYDFPPFFTMQENADTYEKQIGMWCDLVIAYQKHKNQPTIRIHDAVASPLFNNKSLNRKLQQKDIEKVLNCLHKKGNLEWLDKNKSSCLILWKTIDQWADCIYAWVDRSGLANTVCTLFEITNSENNHKEEFYELDEGLLLKAIKVLENRGKAELIGSDGVKFF